MARYALHHDAMKSYHGVMKLVFFCVFIAIRRENEDERGWTFLIRISYGKASFETLERRLLPPEAKF